MLLGVVDTSSNFYLRTLVWWHYDFLSAYRRVNRYVMQVSGASYATVILQWFHIVMIPRLWAIALQDLRQQFHQRTLIIELRQADWRLNIGSGIDPWETSLTVNGALSLFFSLSKVNLCNILLWVLVVGVLLTRAIDSCPNCRVRIDLRLLWLIYLVLPTHCVS